VRVFSRDEILRVNVAFLNPLSKRPCYPGDTFNLKIGDRLPIKIANGTKPQNQLNVRS